MDNVAVKRKRRIILTVAATFFFAAAVVFALILFDGVIKRRSDSPGSREAGLTVMYFRVGRGDAALLSFPDGSNMLIDTGTFDDGARLRAYFDVYGIKHIDRLCYNPSAL